MLTRSPKTVRKVASIIILSAIFTINTSFAMQYIIANLRIIEGDITHYTPTIEHLEEKLAGLKNRKPTADEAIPGGLQITVDGVMMSVRSSRNARIIFLEKKLERLLIEQANANTIQQKQLREELFASI